uniref:Uncharacterized protein n=1 Tax=Rhizophora mucronata TaxID=61149 RepID=A0A2P2KYZ6_RHIMU
MVKFISADIRLAYIFPAMLFDNGSLMSVVEFSL